MKVCKVCLQSDILCSACAKAVGEGSIKKIDVELSRAVHKISAENGFDIDYLETVEGGNRLFVIVDTQHAGRFIGPGGRTIRKISDLVGRQIKLLEKSTGSDRHVIENMLGVPVIGINKIFSASGEALKVRVERKYARSIEPITGVVGKVLNKKISFVFE